MNRIAARSSDGTLSPQHLEVVDRLIESRIAERVQIRDMGSAVGLSAFHFCRIFRSATGTSPHQYLIERRIGAARRLLETTDVPLAEIARRVGFRTQAHFTKVFRVGVGATPAVYRRKSRINPGLPTPQVTQRPPMTAPAVASQAHSPAQAPVQAPAQAGMSSLP